MHAGEVNYVGITKDMVRRQREHLAPGGLGIKIREIPGLTGLTRLEARSVEQVLIREFGGPGGEQLLNSINSIARSRGQFYADAILRGCSLLSAADFPVPKTCG